MTFLSKTTVFIKFVVSFTIFNYYPSLTIVSDDPSLTIDNIIVNEIFFQKPSFLKTIVLTTLLAEDISKKTT